MVSRLSVNVGSGKFWLRHFHEKRYRPMSSGDLENFVKENEGRRFDLEVSGRGKASYSDLVEVLRGLAPIGQGIRILSPEFTEFEKFLLP